MKWQLDTTHAGIRPVVMVYNVSKSIILWEFPVLGRHQYEPGKTRESGEVLCYACPAAI